MKERGHGRLTTGSYTVAVTTTEPTALDDPDADGHSEVDATGEAHRQFWGEEPTPTPSASRARVPRRSRRARRRQLVIRNISVWSVLKVSVLLSMCMWAVLLGAGVVLWRLGDQAGIIEKLESFWADATAAETVDWDGRVVLRAAALGCAAMAVASVGFAFLFGVLFNLICDITGGVRMTVLQVEPRQTRAERRTSREQRRTRDRAPGRGTGRSSAPRRAAAPRELVGDRSGPRRR